MRCRAGVVGARSRRCQQSVLTKLLPRRCARPPEKYTVRMQCGDIYIVQSLGVPRQAWTSQMQQRGPLLQHRAKRRPRQRRLLVLLLGLLHPPQYLL